jgi:hypothetical protein
MSRPFLSLTLLVLLLSPCLQLGAAPAQEGLTGTVRQTMDAAGYTYLQLQTDDAMVWVAVPQTPVTVGQTVNCAPGMVMPEFHSKTLDRTFEGIVFSPGIEGAEPTAVTAPAADSFEAALAAEAGSDPHSNLPMDGVAASAGSIAAVVPSADIQMAKAEGANGRTVGECFSQAAELKDQTVRIRGKVMKNSRMIMGKNWLHIQDGTGDAMQNSHDLVVTTMADPAEGSEVLIEGTLHVDRDFGYGYTYAVIVEDARVEQVTAP